MDPICQMRSKKLSFADLLARIESSIELEHCQSAAGLHVITAYHLPRETCERLLTYCNASQLIELISVGALWRKRSFRKRDHITS